MADELDRPAVLAVYAELGNNYRAIDDLRLRLLALLPLATGTGILVFLGRPAVDSSPYVAIPVGVFGIVATICFYFYELHGVEKCAHFIHRGQQIERQLRVRGSFRERPQAVHKVVSELLPTMVVYPVSLATWLFVTLSAWRQHWFGADARVVAAVTAGILGVAASVALVLVLQNTRETRRTKLEEFNDECKAR
jgi:hypothetical protein